MSLFSCKEKARTRNLKKKKQHHISLLAQTPSFNTPDCRLSFPRNARGFSIIMCGHLDTVFPKLFAYGLEVCTEMTS